MKLKLNTKQKIELANILNRIIELAPDKSNSLLDEFHMDVLNLFSKSDFLIFNKSLFNLKYKNEISCTSRNAFDLVKRVYFKIHNDGHLDQEELLAWHNFEFEYSDYKSIFDQETCKNSANPGKEAFLYIKKLIDFTKGKDVSSILTKLVKLFPEIQEDIKKQYKDIYPIEATASASYILCPAPKPVSQERREQIRQEKEIPNVANYSYPFLNKLSVQERREKICKEKGYSLVLKERAPFSWTDKTQFQSPKSLGL